MGGSPLDEAALLAVRLYHLKVEGQATSARILGLGPLLDPSEDILLIPEPPTPRPLTQDCPILGILLSHLKLHILINALIGIQPLAGLDVTLQEPVAWNHCLV